MTVRAHSIRRLLVLAGLLTALFAVYEPSGDAQTPATPPTGPTTCPGQPMSVQATGVYEQKPVPDITINGKPAPGAIWGPGMRSYWHCHSGGQVLMLDQGVGRIQVRGERMRTLHRGDTHYAGPGVEHWHGAAADQSGHFFQTAIGESTTFWMEEVGREDYMGYDNGLASRAEFLKSGVRKKPDAAR
jgi:hypothetical protein